jgi:hypothetical protein
MIRAAIPIRRVPMSRNHDLHAQFHRPLKRRVEILHFEPKQHTIPVRPVRWITNGSVMMFYSKPMQLQHKLSI